MATKVPELVTEIYDGYSIQPEDFRLDTESAKPGGKSRVVVRALDGFLFMKDGSYVYPTFECSTAEWWKGVVAYGYVAALTGDYRYFVWAGQWDETFDQKHIEVIQIRNIEGMCKDTSRYWRQGEEAILWLESKGGFSYALTEPAEEYDLGHWKSVIKSWTHLPAGESQAYAGFSVVKRDDPKPTWWKGEAAQKVWNHFQRPLKKAKREEQAEKRKEAKEDQKRRKSLQKMLQGKPKIKATGTRNEPSSSTTKRSSNPAAGASGSSAGSKRKRGESSYDSSRLRTRKSGIDYFEHDSPEEDDTARDEEPSSEVSPEPTPEPSNKRQRQVPSPSKAPKPARVKSPKKEQAQKSSGAEEESRRLAPSAETQSSQAGEAAAGSKTTGQQPLSSQPTRAMEGLTIGDSSQKSMEGVSQEVEGSPAGQRNSGEGSSALLESDIPTIAKPGVVLESAAAPEAHTTGTVRPPPRFGSAPPVSSGAAQTLPRAGSFPPAAAPAGLVSIRDPKAQAPAPLNIGANHATLVAPTTAPNPAPTSAPMPAPTPTPAPAHAQYVVALPAPTSTSVSAPAPAPAPALAPVLLTALAAGSSDAASTSVVPPVTAAHTGLAIVAAAEAGPAPPSVQEVSDFELDNMTGRPSKSSGR